MKPLIFATIVLGLYGGAGSALADVMLPSVALNSNLPPVTYEFLFDRAMEVTLAGGATNVTNVQWYLNGSKIADGQPYNPSTGSYFLRYPLQWADAGLYWACYTRDAVEYQSQSFIAVIKETARMVNVSTRCHIAPGQPVIAGFVVSGPVGRKRFLIRAVGPSLARFGVATPLGRPALKLFREDGTEVTDLFPQRNGNNNPFIVEATRKTGAFAFADGTNDLAAFAALQAGMFTVHVSSDGGGAGEALVEVYEFD